VIYFYSHRTLRHVVRHHDQQDCRSDPARKVANAKDRFIVLSEVLDVKTAQFVSVDEAVRNFATLAGPVINGYAFCDLAKQKMQHAKAVEWVEANPYEVMFRPDIPALPGDRVANARRAIANAKDRAAKERAYFDDAKTVEAYYATRKSNEADVKFCWK
jgi:hypothetical protein